MKKINFFVRFQLGIIVLSGFSEGPGSEEVSPETQSGVQKEKV